jgi:hypothetical protein
VPGPRLIELLNRLTHLYKQRLMKPSRKHARSRLLGLNRPGAKLNLLKAKHAAVDVSVVATCNKIDMERTKHIAMAVQEAHACKRRS